MISTIVYPIEAGWIWNSQGWLYKLGFIDFAGSAAIHMVGGVTALIGASIIGLVAGILVVVAVEFIDIKCHVDDPVGAIAVHGVNGLWGTLAAGLFSTETGLLYGGGFHQLGVQAIGVVAIIVWTVITMIIVFKIIAATNGLRVSADEEIQGLDLPEHGLVNAYADFMPSIPSYAYGDVGKSPVIGKVPMVEAVPVINKTSDFSEGRTKITKIQILLKQERFEALKEALMDIGITGMTVSHVLGCGAQRGKPEYYRGVLQEITLLPKIQVDIVVSKVPVKDIIETAKGVLYTGHIGDGKIFIYDVENVIKVRTGEEGYEALQDVE